MIRARFLLRLGLAIFVTAAHSAQGSGQEPPVAQRTVEASSFQAKASNPKPEEATHAILGAFDGYRSRRNGSGHGNKDLDDLILRVVRDPAFPNKVNDIVVECGNSLYQPVLTGTLLAKMCHCPKCVKSGATPRPCVPFPAFTKYCFPWCAD